MTATGGERVSSIFRERGVVTQAIFQVSFEQSEKPTSHTYSILVSHNDIPFLSSIMCSSLPHEYYSLPSFVIPSIRSGTAPLTYQHWPYTLELGLEETIPLSVLISQVTQYFPTRPLTALPRFTLLHDGFG